ncbi:MAG: YhjD/YihY/BrkB family envelope integrity protein [Deltaproteobacteria bacterium]|jgi:membrane protein
MARYNAIYGSFAALPLFLIWLQISWLIVLFGAEISFAHQNVDTYELEPDSLRISNRFKRLLSLLLSYLIVKDFSKGRSPRTDVELSRSLGIPIRLCRQILGELVTGRILSEVKTDQEKESAYQPARDISKLSVASVIAALDNQGVENIPISDIHAREALSETLDRLDEALQESPANRLLADI